jgi:ankyrin repeat protein
MDISNFLIYNNVYDILQRYTAGGKEALIYFKNTLLSLNNINTRSFYSGFSILQYLILFEPDPNARNLIKVLVSDYFPDIDIVDNDGNTILITCALNNNIELMEFLINEGADINIINNCDKTFLDYVHIENKSKVLELISCNVKPAKII